MLFVCPKNNKSGFSILNNNLALCKMIKPLWSGCISSNDQNILKYLENTNIAHLSWSSQGRGYFLPDEITKKVIIDIEKKLPNLPGHVSKFDWAVTRKQALKVLDDFIEFRLSLYGDYQDAMWMKEPLLYHSMISSCLNLKLLNPEEVIKAVEQAYYKNKAPLNAAEGFIRQIIGWREYIHGLYWFYSDVWMNSNALKAKRALPNFYWTGKTKMTCINESVNQVIEYGYSHHIQRLMVTGLFSLLYGVKPSEIHTWYLSMFVDAVAWTEVPNTIGMSQYADGGIVGSKPYIASGAYISRMSNYCKNCNYEPTKSSEENACPFTTLYWYFVYKNRSLLKNNPRLSMQIKITIKINSIFVCTTNPYSSFTIGSIFTV